MTHNNACEFPIVLHEHKIKELCEVLGHKPAMVFVGRFQNELSIRLQELEANRAMPAVLAVIAHKLVGIAGALGLDELASTSHSLSTKARESSTENDLAKGCAAVIAAGNRAMIAVANYGK